MIAIEWMWTKRLAVSYWHKSPFVQAMGIVNDHLVEYFRYAECEAMVSR